MFALLRMEVRGKNQARGRAANGPERHPNTGDALARSRLDGAGKPASIVNRGPGWYNFLQ